MASAGRTQKLAWLGIEGYRVEYRFQAGGRTGDSGTFFKDQAGGTEGPLASGVGMGYL